MRFSKYLVFPEAEQRIIDSGLAARVKEMQESDDEEDSLPCIGAVFDSKIKENIDWMKEEGYFKTFPKEQRKTFFASLQELFKDVRKGKWKIHHADSLVEETAEYEDFYLLAGILPAYVLSPDEIWQHERFGFDSLPDFLSSFGAFIWNASRGEFEHNKPLSWQTEINGRTFVTSIKGSEHYDLRISREEITPYETYDPLGNKVSCRPVVKADNQGAAGYHSTEPSLFVALLKWYEQCNLDSEMLSNNGEAFIEFAQSLEQKGGATTEHLYPGENLWSSRTCLVNLISPLARLDGNYETDERIVYGIPLTGEGGYDIGLGPDDELVFKQTWDDGSGRKAGLVFYPFEIDDALKSLAYQCAAGLGRTAACVLVDLMKHRHSDEFKEQMSRD